MDGTQGLRAQTRHSRHVVSVHAANVRPVNSVTAKQQQRKQVSDYYDEWKLSLTPRARGSAVPLSCHAKAPLPGQLAALQRCTELQATLFTHLAPAAWCTGWSGSGAAPHTPAPLRRRRGGGAGADGKRQTLIKAREKLISSAGARQGSSPPEKRRSSATNTSHRRRAVTEGMLG